MSTYTRSENLTESEINIPPPPEAHPMSDIYNMSATERDSINFLSNDLSEGFSWEKDDIPPPPACVTPPGGRGWENQNPVQQHRLRGQWKGN